jgi:hypothetical protein
MDSLHYRPGSRSACLVLTRPVATSADCITRSRISRIASHSNQERLALSRDGAAAIRASELRVAVVPVTGTGEAL